MRAADVRDMGLGSEPWFGLDMTDAWTAVLSLHGDDDGDWQDMDSDDVTDAIGHDVEGPADTVVELKGDGVVTDNRMRTEPGPYPAS